MIVQVKDQLAGIPVAVANQAKASFQAHFARYPGRRQVDFPHQKGVFFRKIKKSRNVFLWNQQEVDGGSRPDVLENKHGVIFVHYLGRYFFFDYFTKNTILQLKAPPPERITPYFF
jgi:hypothetical protein